MAPLDDRLGYLLKHAQAELTERTAKALSPLGINGRELAVLTVLGAGPALAQQQAAGRLQVDRTTMVDLVDALERKGWWSGAPISPTGDATSCT